MKNTPFQSREAMIEYIKKTLKARDDYRAGQNKTRSEQNKLRTFMVEEAFRDAINR